MNTPIEYCLNAIPKMIELNNKKCINSIEHLLGDNKIRLVLKSNVGWEQEKAKVLLENKEIILGESFLCYLWTCSFLVEIVYNKFVIPILNDCFVDCNSEINKAKELFQWGLGLKPGYTDWNVEFPKPHDAEKNPEIELVNLLFAYACNFILCHEIGHMFLNHTECEGEHAYCQELEADKISYKWILEGIDINNRPVARLGICIALLSSILMDKEANINGTKHPNSFIRLLKYLTWLKIDNNHELWALSLSVIGLWDSKYDIFADFTPKKELGYKERFVTLLTTLGISKNDL